MCEYFFYNQYCTSIHFKVNLLQAHRLTFRQAMRCINLHIIIQIINILVLFKPLTAPQTTTLSLQLKQQLSNTLHKTITNIIQY